MYSCNPTYLLVDHFRLQGTKKEFYAQFSSIGFYLWFSLSLPIALCIMALFNYVYPCKLIVACLVNWLIT